jgi:beta-lactamase class D
MLGHSGVLTLRGNLKKSYDCNQEAIQYASTTLVPDASGEVLVAAQQLSQVGLEILSRKASKLSIQSTGDIALKLIQLQEGDSSKTTVISAGLHEK